MSEIREFITVRHMAPLIFFILTACMLGYYDPACGFSFHILTLSFVLCAPICLLTALLPEKIRIPLQILVGESFILLSLVDVYCQTFLRSAITPSIFSSIIMSDAREMWEFLSAFIDWRVLSRGRILLLVLLFVFFPITFLNPLKRLLRSLWERSNIKNVILSRVMLLCFLLCLAMEIRPLCRFSQYFFLEHDSLNTEQFIFRHCHEQLKLPLFRFLYAGSVTKHSRRLLDDIIHSTRKSKINDCSFLSPHIVLLIGESYNKHHSSLYGYHLETTPCQLSLQQKGQLIRFDDAVSAWNITSNSFLGIFSTWDNSRREPLGEFPLFPALFRKAGYHVTFFSNQYASRGIFRGSTSQSGYFFLSNQKLSSMLFDYRNRRTYPSDMKAVDAFYDYKCSRGDVSYTLDIIHLMGQHFDYRSRYPMGRGRFKAEDIKREDLSQSEREVVMHYDNATYYDDSVIGRLISFYEEDNAIVLFLSDHGEEVFDRPDVMGRLFQSPTSDIAKYEFEVPMWIWCSDKYKDSHPDIFASLLKSRKRPFLTDDLPQILLSLSGIECAFNNDSRNLISNRYQPKKRLIAGEVDYDSLFEKQMSANRTCER